MRAGGMNDDRAGDDGDIREGIAEIVNQDAAEIEVLAAADKSQRDTAIDGQRRNGSPDHPAFDDIHWSAETLDSFITKPKRKQDENKSVGVCGKRAGAVIPVGFFVIGGAFGPAHGEIGNAEGGNVGEIVNRVVQERDAMAENAAKNFRHHQTQRGGHGPSEHGGTKRRVNMPAVTAFVGVRMPGVAVVVAMIMIGAMGMYAHVSHSTRSTGSTQPSGALSGQF